MKNPEKPKRTFSLTRQNIFIPIVLGSVSFLLILLMLMLCLSNINNRKRYQTQNYARYEDNLSSFSALISETDNPCYSIDTQSLYGAPFVAGASKEELERDLIDQGSDLILAEKNPFAANTSSYSLYARLQVLASGNSDLSTLVIYAPESGYYIGVRDGGRYGWIARSDEQMLRVIDWSSSPVTQQDKAIIAGKSTEYISDGLHVVRRLGNGLILIVGFSDAAVRKNLLYPNCGHSYKQLYMALRLMDGSIIEGPSASEAYTFDPAELFTGEPGVRKSHGITFMELISDAPPYSLSIALQETGATDPASSRLFLPFLLLNGIWLIIVAAGSIYVTVYLSRPLHQYDQKLQDQQTTIDQQRLQLRRAHLFRMMLGDNVTAIPTEGLEPLLASYALMVICPENGRWIEGDGSIQELEYQSHIAMFSLRETLQTLLKDWNPEFVICGIELVAILSSCGKNDEEIWSYAEQSLFAANQQCGSPSLRFGISRVHQGAENMEHAYRAARRKLAAFGKQEEERSENVNLSGLVKPNMHMANLIYVEKYAEALHCFLETLETLEKQKSPSLRQQQISSFISLTQCMLMETNPDNAAVLESIGLERLKETSDLLRLKSVWKSVFADLCGRQENKNLGQYSTQFMIIYQYVQAHFRNPDLSLSLLSEEFGLSLSTLSREFQKNLGEGFLDSLHRIRIDAARHEIQYSKKTIAEVAASVGYSNTLTMTRAFKKYLGTTPGAFRK